MKKNSFIKGTISLVISQIMIKIFGVIYTLYLTNKEGFGDKGNAIFMSGYQIYALMLTVSSIGIPNAVSRLIAEKKFIGDNINKHRICMITFIIFGCIGLVLSVLLYIFSDFISIYILQVKETALELKVLAPAIFFVSMSSVFKGYFNGENKIIITAKCQGYEQIVKTVLTICFVELISNSIGTDTILMATYANFATTCACFFSFIYCIFKYKYMKEKNVLMHKNLFKKEKLINIIKNVLIITLPISLTAIVNSFGRNVDSITVVRILKKSIGVEKALEKYGIISSKIDILTTLPLSFNMAIIISLMPELIKNKVRKDKVQLEDDINKSIFITIFLAIPYSFVLFYYYKDIFNLLFPRAESGAQLLQLSSYNILFALLVQIYNGIIQGIGNNVIPLYVCSAGLIIKTIFNFILINIEGIDEKGAIISNLFSNLLSFIILGFYIRKKLKLKLKIVEYTFNGIILSGIVIFLSKILIIYLNNFMNNKISFIFTGIISGFFYIFIIFFVFLCKKTKPLKPLKIKENIF